MVSVKTVIRSIDGSMSFSPFFLSPFKTFTDAFVCSKSIGLLFSEGICCRATAQPMRTIVVFTLIKLVDDDGSKKGRAACKGGFVVHRLRSVRREQTNCEH